MAQRYDVSSMLQELYYTDIPNEYEESFIEKVWLNPPDTFSLAQYNYILRLYNKYIAVPEGATPKFKFNGEHRC